MHLRPLLMVSAVSDPAPALLPRIPDLRHMDACPP